RALAAHRALAPLGPALDRGDLSEADRIASEAAGRDPGSARPWFEYGRALAAHDRAAEAVVAYRRGRALPALDWTAQVVLPRLLHDAGRPEEAEKAVLEANKLSWDVDPWILLEAAWRELPPPRVREVRLARDDYGAVRGFFYPHGAGVPMDRYKATGPHRWTRHRAFVRFRPETASPRVRVTIDMGSPPPSPVTNPTVEVRVNGGLPTTLELSSEVRPYTVEAALASGADLLVQIDAPTWSKVGLPAEQGV